MRCRTVAIHRRWYRSLWASTTLAVESPTDLFVASHWLERSSCRFPVTLLVFRHDHITSQILTTFLYSFYLNFLLKACFKFLQAHQTSRCIGPRPWCHTPRLIVMHVIFRSILKIFEYAAKQACKQLQYNKAKFSEPASINGLPSHT